MPTTEQTPTSRVLHVPLTDAEWLALRRLAFDREQTLGTLVASALQRSYPLNIRNGPPPLTPKEQSE